MRRLLIAALCLAPLAAAAQERPVLRLVQPDPTRTMLNLYDLLSLVQRRHPSTNNSGIPHPAWSSKSATERT